MQETSNLHFKQFKVHRLIPHYLSINTKENYIECRKKGYRMTPKLIIENIDCRNPRWLAFRKAQQLRLVRLLRNFKLIHFLDLQNLLLRDRAFHIDQIIYIAKRMSRTCRFALSDTNSRRDNFRGIFESLPKHVQKLQYLDYSIYKPEDLLFYNEQVLKKRTVFDFFKWQKKLEVLKISPNEGSLMTFNPYQLLKVFPSSLKQIFIKNGCFTGSVEISLKHLESIEEIGFEFNNKSDSNFVVSVIDLLPQLVHLKALKLSFSHQISPSLISSLSKLKTLSNISLLHVKFDSNSRGSIKEFLEIIQQGLTGLTNLNLGFAMENDEELLCLRKCINHLKRLETLRIEIFSMGKCLQNNGSTLFLLREIDELPLVKNLYFTLKHWNLSINKEDYLSEIQPIFKKLFEKPIALETFHFEVNQFKASELGYTNLFKSLQRTAGNLKKLVIMLGKFDSPASKNGQEELLEFIRMLKNIRVLKLKGFDINDKKFYLELVSRTLELKYLRTLNLGELKGNIPGEDLVLGLKAILTP